MTLEPGFPLFSSSVTVIVMTREYHSGLTTSCSLPFAQNTVKLVLFVSDEDGCHRQGRRAEEGKKMKEVFFMFLAASVGVVEGAHHYLKGRK